jgi:hypothetical protein
MTQAEAFERQVVRTGDATTLRGKVPITASLGPTIIVLFTFNPSLMGVRAAAFGAVFTRYRIKYVRIKWLSQATTTSYSALGVYDEGSAAEPTMPTNTSSLLELRASSSTLVGQTVPNFFEWRPSDPSQWMFTNAGVTGSDVRLTNSGILLGGALTASTSFAAEIDYCVVFKGATDIGTS